MGAPRYDGSARGAGTLTSPSCGEQNTAVEHAPPLCHFWLSAEAAMGHRYFTKVAKMPPASIACPT
jgi:hypothetical protein